MWPVPLLGLAECLWSPSMTSPAERLTRLPQGFLGACWKERLSGILAVGGLLMIVVETPPTG